MCDGATILTVALQALVGSVIGTIGGALMIGVCYVIGEAMMQHADEQNRLRERRRVHTSGRVYFADREYITVGARVTYNQFNGGLIRASDAREDKPDDWRVHVVTKLVGSIAFLEPLVPDEPAAA